MASGLRSITDAVSADKEVEEENEDENTRKDSDESGSDSDDEKQGDDKVVGNRAEQDARDNWGRH